MSDMRERILNAMFNSVLAGSYIPIYGTNVAIIFESDERIKIMDLNQSENRFEFRSTDNVCTDAGIVWEVLNRMGYC